MTLPKLLAGTINLWSARYKKAGNTNATFVPVSVLPLIVANGVGVHKNCPGQKSAENV